MNPLLSLQHNTKFFLEFKLQIILLLFSVWVFHSSGLSEIFVLIAHESSENSDKTVYLCMLVRVFAALERERER